VKFLQKLSTLFATPSNDKVYLITVKCHRYGEMIQARLNLANDLSLKYGEGEKIAYFCRKVLMGTQQCFQKVEVELMFDGNRNLFDRQITGGKFVETYEPEFRINLFCTQIYADERRF